MGQVAAPGELIERDREALGARAAIDRPPEHPRSPPARDIMRGGEIARARMLIGGAAVELGDQRGRHRTIGKQIDRAQNRFVRQKSEEHTSELQSLMRISYAVFCLNTTTNKRL